MIHHSIRAEVSPGIWQIAKPLRASSWLARRRQEHACAEQVGHCWHPEVDRDWCCECGRDAPAVQPRLCQLCRAAQEADDDDLLLGARAREVRDTGVRYTLDEVLAEHEVEL